MVRTFLVAALIASVSPSTSFAQDRERALSLDDWRLELEMRGGLEVAISSFEPIERAAEVERVFRDDLAFASAFTVVEAGESSSGADLVVSAELLWTNGEVVCRFKVQSPAASDALFYTQYTAPAGAERRLAHRVADDFLERLGIPGVAETRIAFVTLSEEEGRGRALHVVDYDGHGERQVVSESFLMFSPRWSPDGGAVSYVVFPTRGDAPELRILEGDGGRSLFASEGMVFSSAWSPDGEHVAFSSSHEGNAEIYVIRRDGTGLSRLTDHPGIDVSPTWSPTGRELAFTSTRNGSPQIYIMDGEGLNLRRVSTEGSYNAEPAWSPSRDVSEIAYASRGASGAFHIVVLDLLTGRARRLTSGTAVDESPSWAPNGRHLVFASDRSGKTQIYTVNRDGSNVAQLTFEGENRTPSWSPN